MSENLLTVPADHDGQRLDRFLSSRYPDTATFGLIQKLCRKGAIRIDGKRIKGNERLTTGQEIKIPAVLTAGYSSEEEEPRKKEFHISNDQRKQVESWIIHEDEDLIVLNKPYDLPVQAGSGHTTSIDRLMKSYYAGQFEPRLVHRLDKTTTGCLVFAKTREVASKLARQFQVRDMNKTYLALTHGKLESREGIVDVPLIKMGDRYEKMHAHEEGGKSAVTEYKAIDSAGPYYLLEITPHTGRTHQIRVHLSLIDSPIVGDVKYGGVKPTKSEHLPSGKMFLHAWKINWMDGDETVEFVAPLSEHLNEACDVLGLEGWK